ncbi:hypothetical protein BJ508DRAFT_330342 [Ascobolus immersus RN42]|uniref:F-box domain-containing protein n=1 Tax=Ascobolus immersus RN42 TaxID=1160509 RepID=A0A3N4HTQ4_ASCIM|nr:hypothetical protein BJ508DRAFT_330342 [Ascobolus immersus RN42]
MNKLPLEIIGIIVGHLHDILQNEKLKLMNPYRQETRSKPREIIQYATVSRSFQYAIEPIIYSELKIRSDEIEKWATIIPATSHRAAFVSGIDYLIFLNDYPENRRILFETEKEQAENNKLFTKAIFALFDMINCWESSGDRRDCGRKIHLSMEAYAHCEYQRRNQNRYVFESLCVRDSCERNGFDLGRIRWKHSYLQLDRNAWRKLPDLKRVVSLRQDGGTRQIEGWTLAKMAAKYPNLDKIEWSIKDNDILHGDRVQRRRDFGLALLEGIPIWSTLSSFRLKTGSEIPTNHSFTPPIPCADANAVQEEDLLTRALQHILRIPCLQSFDIGPLKYDLYPVIGPFLFAEPSETDSSGLFPPVWKSEAPFQELTSVSIVMNPLLPDGSYYFAVDNDLEAKGPEISEYERLPSMSTNDFSKLSLAIDQSIREEKELNPEFGNNHVGPSKIHPNETSCQIERTSGQDGLRCLQSEPVEKQASSSDSLRPLRFNERYCHEVKLRTGCDKRHFFRTRPDTVELRQLAGGFVRAVLSMPKIRKAKLEVYGKADWNGAFSIEANGARILESLAKLMDQQEYDRLFDKYKNKDFPSGLEWSLGDPNGLDPSLWGDQAYGSFMQVQNALLARNSWHIRLEKNQRFCVPLLRYLKNLINPEGERLVYISAGSCFLDLDTTI